jgi:hypothetical protein
MKKLLIFALVSLSSVTSAAPQVASIAVERTTNWNPGILSDTTDALGPDGIPIRNTVCATLSPSGADDTNQIQTALNESICHNQVVMLKPGTFNINSTLTIPSFVVLRGSGSQGGTTGTTIVQTQDTAVLAIGAWSPGSPIFDVPCYSSGGYGTVATVIQDAIKETTKININTASAAHISATPSSPAYAVIDEVDDGTTVNNTASSGFRRANNRSTTQRIQIVGVDAKNGILTLGSPLHWTFRAAAPYRAQVAIVSTPITVYAGIEHMLVQGGSNLVPPSYLGAHAGGIELSNAAYSWVKDVRTDATIQGIHLAVTGGFRDVVRDSEFRESRITDYGEDSYGIVIRCATADTLVENNISHYMNKPFVFMSSGGGNVAGYNYFDNAWATDHLTGNSSEIMGNGGTFQESTIDAHNAFPHMELLEGNYATHMSLTTTHGNAGYITFFRNYGSSQFASPWCIDHMPGYVKVHDARNSKIQDANITAFDLQGDDVNINVVANVLGSSDASNIRTSILSGLFVYYTGNSHAAKIWRSILSRLLVYFTVNSDTAKIFTIGGGQSDVVVTSLWAHGNYDTINAKVMWNNGTFGGRSGDNTVRVFANSLYLKQKPAWWPTTSRWPWAGPDVPVNADGLPIATLPAQLRAK